MSEWPQHIGQLIKCSEPFGSLIGLGKVLAIDGEKVFVLIVCGRLQKLRNVFPLKLLKRERLFSRLQLGGSALPIQMFHLLLKRIIG